MASLYTVTRSLWRSVPKPLRDCIHKFKPFGSAINGFKQFAMRVAPHNDVYDAEYYLHVERMAQQSNDAIAGHIMEHFHPSTVLDVGCGTGAVLMALRDRGVSVFGLDYADSALKICRDRGLSVEKFDLESNASIPTRRVDLALSTEVAEHLPATSADRFVDLLCMQSDLVVLTAADPGMGGTDHVNEQPNSYWIEKFAQRGFGYDKGLSMQWRADWEEMQTSLCYYRNLMIFRKNS